MNAHITFGLFALYVAIVSLALVLTGQQDALLSLLRSLWGRTIGHLLYFGARVAVPMLICVLCLGWGIKHYDAKIALAGDEVLLKLNVDTYRELVLSLQKEQAPDPLGVVYGA